MGQEFDYIIIDGPPFMAVTDPVVLGSFVDGVVIVARYHQTSREVMSQIRRRFTEVGARLIGVVLNAVDFKEERYRYQAYSYSYPKASEIKKRSRKNLVREPSRVS